MRSVPLSTVYSDLPNKGGAGAHDGIRTHTLLILSQFPLPVGIHAQYILTKLFLLWGNIMALNLSM